MVSESETHDLETPGPTSIPEDLHMTVESEVEIHDLETTGPTSIPEDLHMTVESESETHYLETTGPTSIPEDLHMTVESESETHDLETTGPTSIPELTNGTKPGNLKRKLNVQEIIGIWSLARLIRDLGNRYQCVTFAEEFGLVATERICRTHRKPMLVSTSSNRSFGSWICHKRTCRDKNKRSRAIGTFFDSVKISLNHVFYLVYAYAHKWDYDMVRVQDPYKEENQTILSQPTISDWYSHCREVVVAYQINNLDNASKIGGPGKIVQIDESQFAKRKYEKGSQIEGSWILGMIEDGSEDLRLELCPNNDRSAETLIPLIKKHVEVGSIIYTDQWHAYDCLDEHGYIHKKVKRSDPENSLLGPDGSNTQRIKSQWGAVKRYYRKDNYHKYSENFTDSVVEYLWRRNLVKYKKDPFMEMIAAIRYVYKVK